VTGLVRSFGDLAAKEQPLAGGKGGTLARLYQAGYPVPDGIVLLPPAFAGDELKPGAWAEARAWLARVRREDAGVAFAVRSSAMSEDASEASFAGEFETVLDVATDEEVRDAIDHVRQSRHSERVRAYSQAKGLAGDHEMAVVVQRLVRARMSGVLFTANPVTGDRSEMMANAVHGSGDKLVSGEADATVFTLRHPKGAYHGPPELQRLAARLFELGVRLENELGSPQDIEWSVGEGDQLYLLQSRPITTLPAVHNPATGDWNESLSGDYLWSNANLSEALPGVATPMTWSLWRTFHVDLSPIDLGEIPLVANICGRGYANFGLLYSTYRLGTSHENALKMAEAIIGRLPEGMDVPLIKVSRSRFLRMAVAAIRWELKFRSLVKVMPEFVAASPEWCRRMRARFPAIRTTGQLASLWRDELQPNLYHALWMLRAGMKLFSDRFIPLDAELTKLMGKADSNALLSNLRGSAGLASLGPVVGLARVARGDMSRQEYRERWGHRGPDELELSAVRPAEDPDWLEREVSRLPDLALDAEELLAKQRAIHDQAWERFRQRFPQRERAISRRIEKVAEGARMREATRSEAARVVGVLREFALRAGDLTGLGDDVFFLYLDELMDLLAGSGGEAGVSHIPARKRAHARYKELPPYPAIIRGRFDPFRWASDPNRRSDVFDATWVPPASVSDTIRGFPGAEGRVEGRVRVLAGANQGADLQPGEILVTVTTNVGWTPLFPRTAAIVTDVGAPLSHTAIVARELGIPAVVGCVDATMRLRTGDLVRVDGGLGTVEVLDRVGQSR